MSSIIPKLKISYHYRKFLFDVWYKRNPKTLTPMIWNHMNKYRFMYTHFHILTTKGKNHFQKSINLYAIFNIPVSNVFERILDRILNWTNVFLSANMHRMVQIPRQVINMIKEESLILINSSLCFHKPKRAKNTFTYCKYHKYYICVCFMLWIAIVKLWLNRLFSQKTYNLVWEREVQSHIFSPNKYFMD